MVGKMKYYEYKITKTPSEEKLNSLGNEGWELITVISNQWTEKAYFKRRKTL